MNFIKVRKIIENVGKVPVVTEITVFMKNDS